MAVIRRRVLLPLVVLGVAGGVTWWWLSQDNNAKDTLTLYGNVDIRQVELAINGSERIASVLAEEGDHIRKGQLLATLETERLEYAVARAQALVETQKQIVARLEAGSRPEEIRKARADLDAAEATARDAELRSERVNDAVKTSAVARQEADNAKAAAESAQARAKAARASLDLVLAGPRKEDIAEARALLKRYEAELKQAQHDLDDAHLRAPCDGVVQERILEVGDMASPQKPVYTIAVTNPMWVRAYVAEPDLGKIREGMGASVTTDSYPEKEYEAWIGFISPTAEFTPKPVETREVRTKLVYQVRVFVRNPNEELRLGMPATVTIPLRQSRPSEPRGTAGNDRESEATEP